MPSRSYPQVRGNSRKANGPAVGLGLLHEVPRLIGEAAAQKLFAGIGGDVFLFPVWKSRNADGERKRRLLIELVGEENAEKLCREFIGGRIYVPKNFAKKLDDRNADLRRRFDAGDSVAKLVLASGLSRRQIETILNRA
jgi:hypothetical protein